MALGVLVSVLSSPHFAKVEGTIQLQKGGVPSSVNNYKFECNDTKGDECEIFYQSFTDTCCTTSNLTCEYNTSCECNTCRACVVEGGGCPNMYGSSCCKGLACFNYTCQSCTTVDNNCSSTDHPACCEGLACIDGRCSNCTPQT